MKRVGYLYDKICDIDNIKLAIKKSSRGKRDHVNVKRVLENIDYYAETIQRMLKTKEYCPTAYDVKIINDGVSKKQRVIHKPAYYPDQIIHWCLILQLELVFMRGMYYYNCGSVPKRGTAHARKALKRWIGKDEKNTKYCLKMDIKKFYPSINNEILKCKLREIIKDNDCLWLLDTIVDSTNGMPIGNYTSPWLSNYYLQELDHYIKHTLGAKYYIRYVDDLVILGSNKKDLHKMRRLIAEKLGEIDLTLKDNWQVFKIDSRSIDFIGYRFARDHIKLRRRNALRIKRRCKKVYKKVKLTTHDAMAIMSYWGWLKNSNSWKFYQLYVKPFVSLFKCRNEVRYANER
jgi:RNA-directed DNA polymerase